VGAASWFKPLHGRQEGLFYRGVKKGGGGLGWGALGKGLYLTWKKGVAEFFAEGGPIYTYEIPADLNLLDAQSREMGDIKAKMGFQPWEYSDDPMFQSIITFEVRDLGYEGVISDNPAEGLVIFDSEGVVVLVEEE
jgi:hypothetical protein